MKVSMLARTHTLRGAQAVKAAAQDLAERSQATLDACDIGTREQITTDVRKVLLAVGNRQRDLSHQSALMAAGALLAGPQGFVVSQLADKLHDVTSQPARLQRFSQEICQAASGGDQMVFRSLATQVLQHGIQPNGLLLSGAFLSSLET